MDSKPLQFLTLNTCGLKSKFIIPECCDFIGQYDIIGLQETKSDTLDSFEIQAILCILNTERTCQRERQEYKTHLIKPQSYIGVSPADHVG